jgi:hypothetical protein
MLTAKLILERFDKDHQLLERREQPSRSFVLGFLKLLYVAHAQIQSGAPYSMNDITNTARNVDSSTSGYSYDRRSKSTLRIGSSPGSSSILCHAGEGTNTSGYCDILHETIQGELIGIVVGTGVAAVTPTDYALGTRLAHGSAAGQLEYGGCELLSITFANPNGQFTIRRYFTNNSGGTITVQEAGIYSVGTYAPVPWYAWPFCIARDLTGAVAVANTELLRVTYVVQITV